MVLMQMTLRYIDPSAIEKIIKDKRIRDHRLVTQIWQTPAYVTYMSSSSKLHIDIQRLLDSLFDLKPL